jgi:putative membrane protein
MTKSLGTILTELVAVCGVGLLLFALSFAAIVAFTPFSIRKEIEQDHNVALAIMIASVVIGISIIVGAVVHG